MVLLPPISRTNRAFRLRMVWTSFKPPRHPDSNSIHHASVAFTEVRSLNFSILKQHQKMIRYSSENAKCFNKKMKRV